MYQRGIIAAGVIVLARIASAAQEPRLDPPKFELSVSSPFSVSGRAERYRAGDVTYSDWSFRFVTTASMTTRYGNFGRHTKNQSDSHTWSVAVYTTFSKKVTAAYASTKDGYQLRMTEGLNIETPDWGSYMVARLRRKRFRWGKAVSFLSQFTQDSELPAPRNGRLEYEVWGVTADRKHTVVARISVSHPKLPDLEDKRETLRYFRTVEALKRDPDYKLIERCKPEEFTPSLTAFDAMLDSLSINDERLPALGTEDSSGSFAAVNSARRPACARGQALIRKDSKVYLNMITYKNILSSEAKRKKGLDRGSQHILTTRFAKRATPFSACALSAMRHR